MKKLLYFLIFAILFVACTNDEPTQFESNMLVKAPKVSIWSGNWQTRASGYSDHYYNKEKHQWPSEFVAPPAITDDEKNFIIDYLENHPNEGFTECNLIDYFIQLIGKSYDEYFTKDSNNADHFVIGSNQMDYISVDGVHYWDYNGSAGPDALCLNWPLNDPVYHDSYGNLENHNMYRFYYIEYNGVTNLYLCFDYTTYKDSGENIPGDGVFNDWVLKITPADGSIIDNPNKPLEKPEIKKDTSVETNLHISEKEGYLESHLSIHVRYPGDVEVFIPIPKQYYCEADDMDIVMKHEPNHQWHNDNIYKFTHKLKDSNLEVTINISYEENGIRIWTEGVTQEVIDWCAEKCDGDGITFEIWNYFNNELSIEKLKQYLDESEIKFLNEPYPEHYINSKPNINDCTVKNS